MNTQEPIDTEMLKKLGGDELNTSVIMLQMLGQKDSEAKNQEALIASLPPGPQKKREEDKLREMIAAQLRLLDTLRSALVTA